MTLNSPPINNRLAFADGLRGFAALWVVLYHIAEGKHIESIRSASPSYLFTPIFEWGHLGVAIFFVLSGFVMGLTVWNSVFNGDNAVRFIGRRLLRLVPPYYFAILFALCFLLLKSKVSGIVFIPPDLSTILHHLTFTQRIAGIPHINIIFWTLCIEVQFYIVFAIFLWLTDAFRNSFNITSTRLYLIAIASIFALAWPLGIIKTIFWQGNFIGFWYSFLSGVVVCWATLGQKRLLRFSIVFSFALVLLGLFYQSSFAITVGVTSCIILLATIINRMQVWLNWAWLQWLGVVSYSLYLLHNPVIGASANITKRFVPQSVLGETITMLLAISTCLVTAYLSYLIIERPSIRLSHMIKLKK